MSLKFDTRVPEQRDLFNSCETYQRSISMRFMLGRAIFLIPGPVRHPRRDLNVARCFPVLDAEKQKA